MTARLGSIPRMGACLLAALFAIALIAAPARGAEVPNHPFLGTLLDGSETPAENLEDACGVAVDSQGSIYVSDYYHHAIDVFVEDPATLRIEYLTQIANVDPLDGPCGLAVDSAGRLYVNDYHRDVIRYTPSFYPPSIGNAPTYGPATVIDSSHPTGIAIDPATNNLYVNDRTYVSAFQPSGAPVLSGGEPLKIGLGSLSDAYGLAISSFPATKGRIYVAEAGDDTVKVYDPALSATNPVEVIDGAGTPQGGFVSLHDSSLALDHSNGHLFVSDNTQPGFEHPVAVVDEFGASGLYRGQLEHAIVDGEPVGIAVDGSAAHEGEVYVTSGNGSSDVFPKVPNPEESVLYAFGPAGAAKILEVAKSGLGEGAVISKPAGIACGSACKAEFNFGASVTLSATPAPGSVFAGWSGACSGTGSCQLSLSSDAAVGAEFLPAPAAPGASAGPIAQSFAAPVTETASQAKPKKASRHHRRAKHRKAKQIGAKR